MVPRHQPPELDAGDQTQRRRIAGVARNGANEHRFVRGLRLRRAGSAAHLKEAAGGAGVQCSSSGGGRSGGRSSGTLGYGVLVHGRTSCGLPRSPADSLSTGWALTRCACALATAAPWSAAVSSRARSENGARRRERRGGARGKQQELTGRPKSSSVGSGRRSGQRIDGRRSSGQRTMMSSMATF